ncbi:TonB-dependent receptor [Sphingobium jiangsuense]|uniref:Iron complex outermembrane receptor protein n=1 Tax=Sphingobium jiangsuense TaxID=870476 RepID=A0A7W6FNV7_9SPHN|nr:TonB-dependent receptor [Sphingobium jiangsuense]MBB3924927.1 iron complex outermembrane receptor protein [Sphingobium jiangsuense]GLS99611.1 TonB-dependent receptor [Sphingobium jiangsuense]
MNFSPRRKLVLLSLLAGSALAPAIPAHAQDGADTGGHHDHLSDQIVVTALIPRTQDDVLAGISVLSGGRLERELRGTIGETLARQPGVSSTSFGPNASRPILRGLQGERVRVLTDGIGSFDVSNTSVDHAVAINPLTAERVEVLRGPAALLYGSSAIGGVVNVIDSRIPHHVPDEAVHLDALATYGSAADERTVSGKVEAPLGGGFVAHADGSWSKSGDLRTGGHILAPALRAEAAASGDADIAALADLRGKLPNSAAESWEIAGALAYVGDGGDIGVSVNHIDNLYGVPVRYALEPGEEAEQVRLHMKQTRADLRAELHPDGAFVDRVRFRAGFADYRHQEIEETGEVGTTFYNKGIEARAELVQAKRGGWDGVIGAQFLARDFHVIGEEKFLPANSTTQFGLFTLQALDLGALRMEAGGRYEHSRVAAKADEDLGLDDPTTRSFDAFSFSAGMSYALAPQWRIGFNVARSERAPSAEELFARGPHAGTQAYELGDPAFGKEKNWGVEASLRGSGADYNLSLSAYHNWFSGYIYNAPVPDDACLAASGESELEFPCYQYAQADARTYGFEAQASATVARRGDARLTLDAAADYVRARIVGAGPAPFIPPLRLQGGAEIADSRWTGRAEIEHGFAQKRVAALETETPAYTLVNASLSFRPFEDRETSLTLSANNIFDTMVRRAASVMKDYAPLAGRDIRLTLRVGI